MVHGVSPKQILIIQILNSANSMRNSSILNAKSPSADESEIEDIAWYARGGKRNEEVPCEGTAYFGGLHPDGTVRWKKSIWWTGGYTEERFNQKVVGRDMTDKWIGWKVIMYNFEANNSTAVRMESYLDIDNDGNWTKVTDLVDRGGMLELLTQSSMMLNVGSRRTI